jgi:hypothetical protein
MKWIVVAVALATASPVAAQRMNELRAGVVAPERASITKVMMAESGGVSRKKLAIGAGVGALVGGIAGGVWVNNSGLSKNEAWPMFVGGGALIGALIGSGLGLAVTAFILP